ncbi:MAG: hypothetical protein EOP42_15050 [Sphingobacteriaceae bacterium]|nr:MAG: hypothetical protein EOP42_15050 [Sphingobacteriaceae bacterium]
MKEGNTVHAVADQTSTHKTEKTHQLKSVNQNQEHTLIKSAAAGEDEDFFVEDDNEDENTVFARKYVLQTSYFLIVSFTFILYFFYSRFKYRLPFCVHLSQIYSHKYLTYRALII